MVTPSIAILPLYNDGTLPPLPLLRQWLREAREVGEVLGLERIPHGNGIIPTLARLGGFDQLRIHRPDLPRSFIWQTPGGAQVTVDNRGGGDESNDTEATTLLGALPPCPAEPAHQRSIERIIRRVEAARLADASAVLGGTVGADWRPPLAALSHAGAPPPIRTQSNYLDESPMRVWNPLPFTRRLVAALPPDGQRPPWAVMDHRGVKHPVQVSEGPLGEQWLTEMELGPLEVVDLVPFEEPLGGEHWEVTQYVIDNGRVRAEFDERGAIARLSFDGAFIEPAGAVVHPLLDSQPLGGPVTIRVLEKGPTRGRLVVTIDDARGLLRLTYTLHAHDDLLQIAATWNPQSDGELILAHPLSADDQPLQIAHESGALRLQSGSAEQRPRHGLRWAQRLSPTPALALVSGRPLTLIPHHQQVVVGDEGVVYALTGSQRRPNALSLGEAALALNVPGRHSGAADIADAAFHLGDHQQLLAVWAARPKNWLIEITFLEQNGSSGSTEIYPHSHLGPVSEARLVNADGEKISELQATKDGDGWIIPYQAYDILLVRLR